MTTLFHMNVEKIRKQPAPMPLRSQALMALRARLPAGTFAIPAELPGIVICHRGKALGLHVMARGEQMTHAEISQVIALREAGMRVEVARGLEQAIAIVREMGVALKEDERHGFRDHYWRETRRRS